MRDPAYESPSVKDERSSHLNSPDKSAFDGASKSKKVDPDSILLSRNSNISTVLPSEEYGMSKKKGKKQVNGGETSIT